MRAEKHQAPWARIQPEFREFFSGEKWEEFP
jgi:hypothetical protein